MSAFTLSCADGQGASGFTGLTLHATAPGRLASDLRRKLAGPLAEVRALEPEIVVFGSGSARAARALLMRDTPLPGKTGPIEAGTLGLFVNALSVDLMFYKYLWVAFMLGAFVRSAYLNQSALRRASV